MIMNSKLQTAIATALKSARIDSNLSQEALGNCCGLDRTYISGVERKIRNPTIKTLEKMLIALKLSEKDFLLQVIKELDNDKI